MPAPTVIGDTEIAGILKNVYADVRKDLVPVICPLLAQVEKSKPGGPSGLKWGGNGVFWANKMTRDVGLTSSSSGFFPPDAVSTEVQLTMGVQRQYVYRELDGLALNGTESSEAAYISIARKAMQSVKTAIKLGFEEQLQGDGSFTKGVISAVGSTTSITVTSPYGIASSGQGGLHLDKGMFVAVLDASASWAILGTATITAVANSGDNATVTLGTAITGMAASDILVPAATATDNSYNKAINGLVNITNRGGSYASLHGQSSATYSRHDAVRMVAGTDTPDAAQPNEMDIKRLIAKVYHRCGENPIEKPKNWLLMTTPGLSMKLAETFLGQRRFDMSANIELKGGFSGINIAGLPLVEDQFVPAGTIYLVHLKDLTWIDAKDWGQVQYGSDNAWRPISGRDAFGTAFGWYGNFGALQRNSHGSIVGYTDTERFSFVA